MIEDLSWNIWLGGGAVLLGLGAAALYWGKAYYFRPSPEELVRRFHELEGSIRHEEILIRSSLDALRYHRRLGRETLELQHSLTDEIANIGALRKLFMEEVLEPRLGPRGSAALLEEFLRALGKPESLIEMELTMPHSLEWAEAMNHQAWVTLKTMGDQWNRATRTLDLVAQELLATKEALAASRASLAQAVAEQAAVRQALEALGEVIPGVVVPPVAVPEVLPPVAVPEVLPPVVLPPALPWWAIVGGTALAFLGLGYFYQVAPAAGLVFQLKKSLACWAVVTGITGVATCLGLLPGYLLLPVSLGLRLGLLYGWRRFHGPPGALPAKPMTP